MEAVMENLPPVDVLAGFVCVFIFGIFLGAMIYLPIAHKNSALPLERLTGDLICHYVPDWVLIFLSCVFFLVMSFILISGMWRM